MLLLIILAIVAFLNPHECSLLLQERIHQRGLKVHEKTTYATRVNFKTASMIHPTDSDDGGDRSDEDDSRALAVKDDPQFTLAVTRGTTTSAPCNICLLKNPVQRLFFPIQTN